MDLSFETRLKVSIYKRETIMDTNWKRRTELDTKWKIGQKWKLHKIEKWSKMRSGRNWKLDKMKNWTNWKIGKMDKTENYLTISEKFGQLGQTRKVGQNSRFKIWDKIKKLCHNATEKQQNRSKEARRTDARGCFVFRKGLGVNRVLNCGLECNAYKKY